MSDIERLPAEVEAVGYLRPVICAHCGGTGFGRPGQIFCSTACHHESRRGRQCGVDGCARKHYGHDLCHMHLARLKRTGSLVSNSDFVVVPASEPQPVVFGSNLLPPQTWLLMAEEENGCWRFTGGSTNQQGHGKAKVGGESWGVHRLTYTVFVGAIPPGYHLDHFKFPECGCIGPSCCHPEHVRPATPRENTLRGSGPTAWNAARTHCSKCGLPLSGENVYVNDKGRACKRCKVAATRRWRARKALARKVAS